MHLTKKRLHLQSLALAIFLTLSVTAYADDTLLQAQQLLRDGNPQAAFQLLEPLESARAGDPEFDYAFGIAALDSGQAGRAFFALERVLAVNPQHAQARAEIARAHYMLGEHESARIEFKHVLDSKPPETAIATINRYMSAIDRALGETTRFAAYLEATWGHDSNVNSAPGPGQVIANIGGVPLPVNITGAGAELSSNFLSFGGGISFQHPFNKQLSVFGGVAGSKRNNFEDQAEVFDTGSLDFNLGLSYRKNNDTFTAAWQDNNFYLNSAHYRKAYGLTGQWQHNLDDKNQVSVFGQLMRLEYPQTDIRDADRRVIGAGFGHAFSGDRSPVVFASVYIGEEEERRSNVPHLGHDLWGARIGGQVTVNPKTALFAGAGYEHRDYGGIKPFFTESQEDKQLDFSVGARYTPIKNWQIKPQFSYIHNNSNIAITDYDRYMLSVNFRHDFEW